MSENDLHNNLEINKPKNKGGRPNKNLVFVAERKQVLNKLLDILGITENNDIFFPCDIEADQNKINQILEMQDDIKKYFKCNGWSCFKRDHECLWLSIVKAVLKAMNMNPIRSYIVDKNILSKKGIRVNVIN